MATTTGIKTYQTEKTEKSETIEHTLSIYSNIADVFRALTVSKMVDGWGGGPARIQARVNGRYSLWDGDMYGVIKEYEFPRRFAHTLRETHWDQTYLDSLVIWNLTENPWGTGLNLQHTGLPNRKMRDIHEEGWGEYFLGPMKAYLDRKFKSV